MFGNCVYIDYTRNISEAVLIFITQNRKRKDPMDRERQQKSAAYGVHLLKCAVLRTLYQECKLGSRDYLSTREIRENLGLQNPAVNANLVRGVLEYLRSEGYVKEARFVQGTWEITMKGVKFIEGRNA